MLFVEYNNLLTRSVVIGEGTYSKIDTLFIHLRLTCDLSASQHSLRTCADATRPLVLSELSPTEKPQSPFLLPDLKEKLEGERREKLKWLGQLNKLRCSAEPFYPTDLVEMSTVNASPAQICVSMPNRSDFGVGQGYFHCKYSKCADVNDFWHSTQALSNAIKSPDERLDSMRDDLSRFVFAVPPASAPPIEMHVSHPDPHQKQQDILFQELLHREFSPKCDLFHPFVSNIRTQFPELRLIQYDCGKLQTLDALLWQLKAGQHRVLIFTQMSRMLDIFEQFLSYHGHTYLRLDGATKVEQRQALMERFNADKKIFCFILSTRSGGIGVNLTAAGTFITLPDRVLTCRSLADTVIFYDSDWNPTMDAQAQDRCHRIGQTRDVHIYRYVRVQGVRVEITNERFTRVEALDGTRARLSHFCVFVSLLSV